MKQILITVGTTKFEGLIRNIDKEDLYKFLDNEGFEKLIFQKGSGEYVPNNFKSLTLKNLKKMKKTIF